MIVGEKSFVFFKGPLLFTYRFIMECLGIGILSTVFWPSDIVYRVLFVCIILAYWLLWGYNGYYYFGVSAKELKVKNQLCFWSQRTYQLDKISSVRIDVPPVTGKHTEPYYLRVYTSSTQYKEYDASSLSFKKWHLLTLELRKYNVPVIVDPKIFE